MSRRTPRNLPCPPKPRRTDKTPADDTPAPDADTQPDAPAPDTDTQPDTPVPDTPWTDPAEPEPAPEPVQETPSEPVQDTPAQDPEPSAPAYPVLQKGSQGDDVKKMQAILVGLGWPMSPYGADGDFGDLTAAALSAFQSKNGLQANGNCDAATWQVLLSGSAKGANYIEPIQPAPTPPYMIALLHALDGSGRVEQIDIEEYLRSVVPSEMYADWPMEALKAQAIAARTFACCRRDWNPDRAWDVSDRSGDSQAYDPKRIDARTDAAIKATAGMIMIYSGRPIDAQFNDANGGHIADGGTPYLIAKSDPYCQKVNDSHGRGMAQWGAYSMAVQGMTCEQILQFYYNFDKGVSIVPISAASIRPPKSAANSQNPSLPAIKKGKRRYHKRKEATNILAELWLVKLHR